MYSPFIARFMPRRPWTLLLLLLSVSQTGCASKSWRREIAFSVPGLHVFREHLVEDDQKAALGFSHPMTTNAETLARVLSRARYRRSYLLRKSEEGFVFTPEEVQVLTVQIANLLKTLTPDERIRFVVLHDSAFEAFFGLQGSSGVIFSVGENTLELAFDRVHEGMPEVHEEDPKDYHFPFEPTEYRKASYVRVDLNGVDYHVDDGIEYPRWLSLNFDAIQIPETLAAGTSRAEAPRTETSTAETSTTDARSTRDSEPKPASVATKGAPSPTVTAESGTSAVTTTPGTQPSDDEDLEFQRVSAALRLLTRLRDEGAISDEEYEERRDRVLTEATGP